MEKVWVYELILYVPQVFECSEQVSGSHEICNVGVSYTDWRFNLPGIMVLHLRQLSKGDL